MTNNKLGQYSQPCDRQQVNFLLVIISNNTSPIEKRAKKISEGKFVNWAVKMNLE